MPTREIEAKLTAQPGTDRYFSSGENKLRVAGLAGPTGSTAYLGRPVLGPVPDDRRPWFNGRVRPSYRRFLTATGLHVGRPSP